MLIERLKLFREISIDCSASGNIAVDVSTDLPTTLAVRRSITTSTSGRQTIRIRLPWTTRGYHVRLRITPASGATVEVFEAKVQAKAVGLPEPTGWGWFSVAVRQTPEGWGTANLPIRETPEGWGVGHLPIAETPEGFRAASVAMPSFDPVPRWIEFPMDEIA